MKTQMKISMFPVVFTGIMKDKYVITHIDVKIESL